MTDIQSIESIFERYVTNGCDVYEIKFLLKHFITGEYELVLRQLIAEKLTEHTVDENVDILTSKTLNTSFKAILKAIK